MKQVCLPLFQEQRARFGLRFTCEHCTYFDSDRPRCTHGYPTEQHRAARYDGNASELIFCKEFELR